MVGRVQFPLTDYCRQKSSAHLCGCPTSYQAMLQIWCPRVGLRMLLEISVTWWETTADK